LDGDPLQVEAEFPLLQKIIQNSGAQEFHTAKDESDRLRIWKGRKSAFSAVGRLSPDYLVNDGVVPRSRLGKALAEIGRLSEECGLRVANVFHAGDGNLHPLILFDGSQPGEFERAKHLSSEILELCIRMGGSITGEHGIGMEKRAFLKRMFTDIDVETMHNIRLAIDPVEISNRGKMFSD
jgi:glycolate oxidase